MAPLLCAALADIAPGPLPGPPLVGNNLVFYGVVGVALLALLLLVLWVRRGRPAPVDPEAGLVESFADYPPPGPGPQPVRERLLDVMLPPNKQGATGQSVTAPHGVAVGGDVKNSPITIGNPSSGK